MIKSKGFELTINKGIEKEMIRTLEAGAGGLVLIAYYKGHLATFVNNELRDTPEWDVVLDLAQKIYEKNYAKKVY